jgi:hypothetical protein
LAAEFVVLDDQAGESGKRGKEIEIMSKVRGPWPANDQEGTDGFAATQQWYSSNGRPTRTLDSDALRTPRQARPGIDHGGSRLYDACGQLPGMLRDLLLATGTLDGNTLRSSAVRVCDIDRDSLSVYSRQHSLGDRVQHGTRLIGGTA